MAITHTHMEKMEKLQRENAMLKQLLTYGKIFINYDSSDCDGGHSGGHAVFSSIDEVYDWWDDKAEWSDGPFSWHLTTPSEVQESYIYFTR